MNVLAFETSSEQGSLALQVGEEISEVLIESPRQQTEQLLPFAQQLLATAELRLADLDGIAFGCGPGSFTGIRIAAAAVQGLGLASGLPLLPVSSLAVIAQGLWRSHGVANSLVCVNAHMGEVFWAVFEIQEGLARLLGEERLTAPESVNSAGLSAWAAAGSGFQAYEKILAPMSVAASEVWGEARPCARDVLAQATADLVAGRGRLPEGAIPVYLRSEAAWEK